MFRRFVWDEASDTVRVMIALPNQDGEVDLVIMPEPITSIRSLGVARHTADYIFRDKASFIARNNQIGFEVEDLFMKICLKLGFEFAHQARPEAPFMIRRAGFNEDHLEKVDFYLKFPHTDWIPLQLTDAHRKDVNPVKWAKIVHNEVAYLVFDMFVKSWDRRRELLRVAADHETTCGYAAWLVLQMIIVACQKYLGYQLETIPGPPLDESYLTLEYIEMFRLHFAKQIRSAAQAVRSEHRLDDVAYIQAFRTACMPMLFEVKAPYGSARYTFMQHPT